MIIGQDKERVRMLEIQLKSAEELIRCLRKDLSEIGSAIEMKNMTMAVSDPYVRIFEDIGRCDGYFDSWKNK